MQIGNLSKTINLFFSLFTQSDQDENEMTNTQCEISLKDSSGSNTNELKRANDVEDTFESQKRSRVVLDDKDKYRIMSFNRNSRQRPKETHSKSISFVKVKQISPPKIRQISTSTNAIHLGPASNLVPESRNGYDYNHNNLSQRFPINRKSFSPFVMPFSTPFHGFQDFKNYQSRARNVNRDGHFTQRNRPKYHYQPLIIMTKDDLIDEFLKDADPFQWTYPAPCHIRMNVKTFNEKQFDLCSSSKIDHNMETEEGQLDV